jgi:hypothetical protein
VGPLTGVDGRPGLELSYLDGAGVPATSGPDIRRIVATLRSFSRVRDQSGKLVVDSLTTSIHTRN